MYRFILLIVAILMALGSKDLWAVRCGAFAGGMILGDLIWVWMIGRKK